MLVIKEAKDLKDVAMDRSKISVKNPSYEISDNGQLLFVVTSGVNGVEYNKTEGFFSDYPGMQTYQCLYGQGILVMQRNDESGEAKEFKVVSLNQGRQVLVPAGWGMCIANTGLSYLVVLRNSFLDDKYIDEKPVLKKKGFVYFIVEKKGEISFEENTNYELHPQITTE